MYLTAIAWMYVVLMMAIVEATASTGSVLGALFTFLLYGVLPLSIVLYVMAAPARRAAKRQAPAPPEPASTDPDGRGHAAGDPISPVREEP